MAILMQSPIILNYMQRIDEATVKAKLFILLNVPKNLNNKPV